MKPSVFIHTNEKQMLGALLSSYSIRKYSSRNDTFDIKIIELQDFPSLLKFNGCTYLRSGKESVWRKNDLQSFTLLRFAVPELMNFGGRALVIDPDVFAVTDIYELLTTEMNEKSILCREHSKIKGAFRGFASSVMLLDCAKLKHWRWESIISALFEKKLDYSNIMQLLDEDPSTIGSIHETWNHYDSLCHDTKMIHYTNRITQPWKTGLAIDFENHTTNRIGLRTRFKRAFSRQRYQRHPDINQENFFLDLLKGGMEAGAISSDFIRSEVNRGHIRKDIFEAIAKS